MAVIAFLLAWVFHNTFFCSIVSVPVLIVIAIVSASYDPEKQDREDDWMKQYSEKE
jgi:hypothetical protein